MNSYPEVPLRLDSHQDQKKVLSYSWAHQSCQTVQCIRGHLFSLLCTCRFMFGNYNGSVINCRHFYHVFVFLVIILWSCELSSTIGCWLFLVEGKKPVTACAVTFHINAMDKATTETVKEKLMKKAKDLIETVEIKEDGIKRFGKHLSSKIKSLGTSDVTVDIGIDAHCYKWRFLPHDTCISVAYAIMQCLSVCLVTVKFMYCIEMSKNIPNFFHHRLATPFKFFLHRILWQYSNGYPLTGASNTGGVWKKSRFSTSILLYFRNDASQGHSYYRTPIGTPIQSINWCHFQWPWMTSNPDF